MNFNPRFLIFFALVAVLAVWALVGNKESESLTIASGKPGGGYQTFCHALSNLVRQAGLKIEIEVTESQGGVDNFHKVDRREADLGLVQLSETRSENVRALATVYSDVVHVLTLKESKIHFLTELSGSKIAVGLPNSGTRAVSEILLNHYGMHKSKDLLVESNPIASLEQLLSGEVEALILVTDLRAPVILDALKSGRTKHIRIAKDGAVDGLCSGSYGFEKGVISPHSFAKKKNMSSAMPEAPIEVIKVPSQLVCRHDLENHVAYAVTKAIFENRDLLEFEIPAVRDMRELIKTTGVGFRTHPGANKFYLRREPGFLTIYADVIALFLSVVIASVGFFAFVRKWWNRRLKNRIDKYYQALNKILVRIEQNQVEDFDKVEAELLHLRHKAFNELVDEQLQADHSFMIFQNLLSECQRALKREQQRGVQE